MKSLTPAVLLFALCPLGAAQDSMAPAAQDVAAPSAAPVPLLDMALAAVSKMPTRPHLKTRAKLKAELVEAALKVGRVADAKVWAGGIENWRRGLALAHVAVHLAGAGEAHRDEALAALGAAEAAEKAIVDEASQGWRRDRVRVRIAEAYALMGRPEDAAAIQMKAVPSESGRLASMAVRDSGGKGADERKKTLMAIAKSGDLEQIRFALLAMTEYYGLSGTDSEADAAERASVEAAIRGGWDEVPIQPRIDILEKLQAFDVAAGRREEAVVRAAEILDLVTANRWNQEQAIALRARAAGLFQAAGDVEKARTVANDALALYDTSRASIVSIYRGEALRPLARAYLAMGDHETGSNLLVRALEEAIENPNSRPRATDLAATAIVAATADGFAIPALLRSAFARTVKSIGDPW